MCRNLYSLSTLREPFFQNFIAKCLEKDPQKRPTARELLFHQVLFEVHSLKLLAAHSLVKHPVYLEMAGKGTRFILLAERRAILWDGTAVPVF